MNVFKELDIDNWQELTSIILSYVLTNKNLYNREDNLSLVPIPNYFFSIIKPIIDRLTFQYNITCINAYLYIMKNSNDGSLHSDNSKISARINLPILNCENTFTEFYNVDKWKYFKNTKYTIKLPDENATLELLGKLELKQPTVISVNTFHRIIMDDNKSPRISLSLLFDKDVNFLLE
jgi:hypothetical protein